MWTIRQCKFDNGERICLPFDGLTPEFYPTYYVTRQLRGVSDSTQRNTLNNLRFLPYWERDSGISLVDRIKAGDELTELEFKGLVDFCSYTKETAERILSGSKLLPTAYSYVNSETKRNRLKAIQHYVKFLYAVVSKHPERERHVNSIEKKFYGNMPKFRRTLMIDEEKKLSDEQLDILLNKILPGSPVNPWNNEALQHRNLLMIHVLYETGMRKSEMLGLYVEDVDFINQAIRVRRRHHDPADPRLFQPHQKTKERNINVPEEMINALYRYIIEFRNVHKAAKKHPVLFVNHERRGVGMPLSIPGFNYVMSRILKAFPVMRGVHPHLIRHHFNYRFSKMLESLPEWESMSPQERENLDTATRSDIMGWNPEGVMQRLYNKRYYKEVANRAMSNRVARLEGGVETSV